MTTLATKPDLVYVPDPPPDWEQFDFADEPTGIDPVTSMAFELNRHQRSIELLEAAAAEYCEEIHTLKRSNHDLHASVHDLTARALAQDVVDAPF